VRHHILSFSGLQTLSDRACAPGDQFFEDYGDNPTHIYVEHHGFVPGEENPFDCVPIPLPRLNHDSNEHANQRIDLLSALGVHGMPSNCIPCDLDRVDRDLRYFLWVVHLEPAQLEACVTSLSSGHNLPDCQYALHPPAPRDRVVVTALLDAATSRLVAYTEVPDSNEVSFPGLETSNDMRLAILFCLSQKRVLQRLAREAADEVQTSSAGTEVAGTVASYQLGPLVDRVLRFNCWTRSRRWPVLHIEAAILDSHGGRAGAIATKPLTPGEVYIEIPESDCLTVEMARYELGIAVQSMSDFHALLFFLVQQALLMLDSDGAMNVSTNQFGPYLALLPGIDIVVHAAQGPQQEPPHEEYSHLPPLLWASTPGEAAVLAQSSLKGSTLARAVPQYVASTWHSYNVALQQVDQRELAKIIRRVDVALSWKVFRWAAQILDSRSIWWNGRRHLVPMLDLVNAVLDCVTLDMRCTY